MIKVSPEKLKIHKICGSSVKAAPHLRQKKEGIKNASLNTGQQGIL